MNTPYCQCDPFTGDECRACRESKMVPKDKYEAMRRLVAAAGKACTELSYLVEQVQAKEGGSVMTAHHELRDALRAWKGGET